MIKNYINWLSESEHDDTRLVDFFANLARNYETKRPFYTDQVQFDIEQEWRNWPETIKEVKLEKMVDLEADYKIKFFLDQKNYILKLKFIFTIMGQKEKDAPEALSDEDVDRLNITLEKIKVLELDLKTTEFDIKKTQKELTLPVKKACEAFLVKALESDYDSLGAEIYKIEQ